MSKSAQMYKDSPKLKRKESGEMGIEKPSEADGENMGTEGNPLPGGEDGLPVQVEQMQDRHATEMKDTHKRHEDEVKAMHKRHLKEVKKVMTGKEDSEDKDAK